MSEVFQAVWQFLGVQPLQTSVYDLQTNGLVERFNGTLKQMLRKFVSESGKDWLQWVPFLLFAVREVPQASAWFSCFELLYGGTASEYLGCTQRRVGNASPDGGSTRLVP